jgi:starch synthase
LPYAITRAFEEAETKFNFLILGSGDPAVENALKYLQNRWVGYYNTQIGYNEKLSHQMYAGADFLLMPSRVEPCGLNQLYALRYGTVPVVRSIGGLKDTVIDYEDENGYGICFNNASVDDIVYSIKRALQLYQNKKKLIEIRKYMMELKNSWEISAQKYIDLYISLQ